MQAPDAQAAADDASFALDMDELLSFADELEASEREQAPPDVSETQDDPEEDDAGDGEFGNDELELLQRIGHALSEAMSGELYDADPLDEMSNEERQEVMFIIFDKVIKAMKKKGSRELDEEDLAFVKSRVQKEALQLASKRNGTPLPVTTRRFAPLDRVVCRVGGEREWAAGTVQALDQENEDKDPYKLFPYAVKVDPPNSFGFFAPDDTNAQIRAEVCFRAADDAHRAWALRCLPRAKARGTRRASARRFRVGERVACAVVAADENFTDWAAGTVRAVDHAVEGVGGVDGGQVPYLVEMDGGSSVLVHQDEHWLVRDLELQPAGPRVAADGTRSLARMGKRKLGEQWQTVDHVTRNVRPLRSDASDGSDSDE